MSCAFLTDYFASAPHRDAEHKVYERHLRRLRSVCPYRECQQSDLCLLPTSEGTGSKVFVDAVHRNRALAHSIRHERRREYGTDGPFARVGAIGSGARPDQVEHAADVAAAADVGIAGVMIDQFLERRTAAGAVLRDKQTLGRSKEIDRSRLVAETVLSGIRSLAPVHCSDVLPLGRTASERQRRRRAIEGARTLLRTDGEALGLLDVAERIISQFCAPKRIVS